MAHPRPFALLAALLAAAAPASADSLAEKHPDWTRSENSKNGTALLKCAAARCGVGSTVSLSVQQNGDVDQSDEIAAIRSKAALQNLRFEMRSEPKVETANGVSISTMTFELIPPPGVQYQRYWRAGLFATGPNERVSLVSSADTAELSQQNFDEFSPNGGGAPR